MHVWQSVCVLAVILYQILSYGLTCQLCICFGCHKSLMLNKILVWFCADFETFYEVFARCRRRPTGRHRKLAWVQRLGPSLG